MYNVCTADVQWPTHSAQALPAGSRSADCGHCGTLVARESAPKEENRITHTHTLPSPTLTLSHHHTLPHTLHLTTAHSITLALCRSTKSSPPPLTLTSPSTSYHSLPHPGLPLPPPPPHTPPLPSPPPPPSTPSPWPCAGRPSPPDSVHPLHEAPLSRPSARAYPPRSKHRPVPPPHLMRGRGHHEECKIIFYSV